MMNVAKFHILKLKFIELLLPAELPSVIVIAPPSALTVIDTDMKPPLAVEAIDIDMMKIIADIVIIDMNTFLLEFYQICSV
jgi:hypothetical protein